MGFLNSNKSHYPSFQYLRKLLKEQTKNKVSASASAWTKHLILSGPEPQLALLFHHGRHFAQVNIGSQWNQHQDLSRKIAMIRLMKLSQMITIKRRLNCTATHYHMILAM